MKKDIRLYILLGFIAIVLMLMGAMSCSPKFKGHTTTTVQKCPTYNDKLNNYNYKYKQPVVNYDRKNR